ncbi:MAG: LON peptidase substrate-binding domain-containing protein [Halioglobus sp.]
MSVIDVALFPIPGSVTFPGVPCPLHVFEPRYRQMVRYCMENTVPLGICHTEKLLHANDREQTREEALNSNQDTYKPHEIFSAGPVRLLDEMDDGRLMVSVETDTRLVLAEEKQTLPFAVWSCEELADNVLEPHQEEEICLWREKIIKRLLAVTHGHEAVQEHLRSNYWQELSHQQFGFAVAGRLGMDPETAQALLGTTDTAYRLSTLLEMLNRT